MTMKFKRDASRRTLSNSRNVATIRRTTMYIEHGIVGIETNAQLHGEKMESTLTLFISNLICHFCDTFSVSRHSPSVLTLNPIMASRSDAWPRGHRRRRPLNDSWPHRRRPPVGALLPHPAALHGGEAAVVVVLHAAQPPRAIEAVHIGADAVIEL